MNNLQVCLHPLELHYKTKDAMCVKLVYKKIFISTDYEVQKYQCKKPFSFKNHIATLNDHYSIKMCKEMQLNNLKVMIVLIAIKGRDISFIGDVLIELGKHYQNCQKQYELELKLPINRCIDTQGYLLIKLSFYPIVNSAKGISKIRPTANITNKFQDRDALCTSHKFNKDIPTAYQISRKNYKRAVVMRQNSNSAHNSPSCKKKSVNYSRKYRNQQVKKLQETPTNRSNKIKNLKKESPTPRLKTPEPINYQPKEQKTNATTKLNNFSSLEQSRDIKQQELHDNITTFRAHQRSQQCARKEQTIQCMKRKQQLRQKRQSSQRQQFQQKESDSNSQKYRLITQKLELIEKKIKMQKQFQTQSSIQEDADKTESQIQPNSIRQTFGKSQDGYNFTDKLSSPQIRHSPEKKSPIKANQSMIDHTSHYYGRNGKNNSEFKRQGQQFKKQGQQFKKQGQQFKKQGQQFKKQGQQFKVEHRLKDKEHQIKDKDKVAYVRIKDSQQEEPFEFIPFEKEVNRRANTDRQPAQKYKVGQKGKQVSQQKLNSLLESLKEQNAICQNRIDLLIMQKEEDAKEKEELRQEIIRLNAKIKKLEGEKSDNRALIGKLTNHYEQSGDKLIQLQENYQKKCRKLEEELKLLLQKNLAQEQSLDKMHAQMQQNKNAVQLPKQGRSYKEEYFAQKKKSVNLQAQIRYKQNEIKFLKMRENNLKEENKNMEKQIDMMIAKNDSQLKKKGSLSKLQTENHHIATTVKLENKALKEQIGLLQKQVQELNQLLESVGSKNIAFEEFTSKLFPRQAACQEHQIYAKKCAALQEKVGAFQTDAMQSKSKLGEIINIVWKNGNPQLIDMIDRAISKD